MNNPKKYLFLFLALLLSIPTLAFARIDRNSEISHSRFIPISAVENLKEEKSLRKRRKRRKNRRQQDDTSYYSDRFENLIIGGSSRFGLPSGFDDPTLRAGSLQDDWNDIWLRSGIVPEKIDSLPDGRLELYYPSGINIRPNDSVTPGLTLQFPELKWNAVPSAQYTVMLVDVDIFQPDSDVTNFFHYMSINVPGDRIDDGDLIYEYVPPFAFLYNPAQGLVQDLDFTHTMVWMVFRQSGRIEMRAEQNLCSTELFGRLMNHQEFVLKNDLGVPVAGNFLRALYRPDPVYQLLCFFSRCSGRPFPALLEGVNDGPECISDNPAPEGEGEGHSG